MPLRLIEFTTQEVTDVRCDELFRDQPMLGVCGMLLGSGNGVLAAGAGLLVLANIISVNLAGVVTFLAQGVRPRSWWEAERAKKATRLAIVVWLGLLVLLVSVIVVGTQ